MTTQILNGPNKRPESNTASESPHPDTSRLRSPETRMIEDALLQADLKGSPTRVLDFNEADLYEEDPSDESKQQDGNSDTIFRKLAPPAIAKSPSRRNKNGKAKTGQALPTLCESSSSEDDVGSSFEEEEDDMRRSRDYIGPMLQKNQIRRLTYRKAGSREKIEELETTASDLALKGSEQEAIEVYQQALLITRSDVVRIKKQLKQVTAKHPSTVESIHSRLHEDWLQVGLSIARIRTMMAILYERLGDNERAIACCKEAREVYKRQKGYVKKWNVNVKQEMNVDDAADQMETMVRKMSLAQETFEDRKKLHEEIIMWRTKIAMTQDEEMKKTLYRTVEKKLTTVRNVEVDILGEGHPQIGETSWLLAVICVERNHIEKALKHMSEALSITRLSLGMQHPRTGERFCELARIYEKRRSDRTYENLAIENYELAAKVFRESSASPRRVGSILNDIAVIHIRRRAFEKAVQLLSDALECYESAGVDKAEEDICTDTVQIWRNLGESYSSRRQFEDAANAFVSALNLQRDARKMKDASPDSPPVDFVDDESIANTLRRLGKAYAGMGKYRHSLVVLKEALVIHRLEVSKAMQVTKGRANPDLPGKQDQLAHTRFCMAEVQEASGHYPEAVTLYSESLQLRLFSDAHKGEKERTNMIHCAMCLAGIGSVHMKKNEFAEAHKVFGDAMNYCNAHGK